MTAKKGYTLYRLEGADQVEVGAFGSLAEAFAAGQDAVHVDAEHAYVAYHGERRVARFGFSRLERASDASPEFAGLLS
jgi:uncharacterized protein (AIM24 family)